jgi:phosphatidylglycerol:prolipoprotein diacylglycerol transferase
MIIYPDLDPNAIVLGGFSIKWYGICHFVAFILCYWRLIAKKTAAWTNEQVTDLAFYLVVGMIFGGRIGYLLFYSPQDITLNPVNLFQFWLPGRSFHGGLLGVLLAILVYSYNSRRAFLDVTDFIAPVIPIGIALGRIGNFINGELWGRVTDVPWAMVFPHVDQLPRHPSQIYEFLLEGVALFLILNINFKSSNTVNNSLCNNICKNKSGLFLVFYAIVRIFVENYREPDFQGIFSNYLTMGQLLSIPMLVVGLGLIAWRYNKLVTNKAS